MMAQETFAEKLSEILVKQRSIPANESHSLARAFAESEHDYFDDFLLEEGLVNRPDLLDALSAYYKVPAFDVDGYFFERFLLQKFPKDFLIRNASIPLEVEENMMMVVTSEPDKDGLERAFRQFVSYDVNFLVGLRKDIIDAIEDFYDESLTEATEDTGPL
jgi:hypothetical protein